MTRTKPRANANQPNNFVSVLDFGAKGDGVTDDTSALQAAFDTGSNIYVPPGVYKATSTLNVTTTGQVIYGDARKDSSNASEIKLDSGASDNVLFQISGSKVSLEKLTLACKGHNISNTITISAEQSAAGDVDLEIHNCALIETRTAIDIKGRGLNIQGCNFTRFTIGVNIDFPDPYSPGSGLNQTIKTGMRYYRINNCRFHASLDQFIIRNRGYNAANLMGLAFTNNFSDCTSAVFQGPLTYGLFQNNVHIHVDQSTFAMFDFTGAVNDVVINGNIYHGLKAADEDDDYTMRRVMQLKSGSSSVQFTNNSVDRVNEECITLGGSDHSNVRISGNSFKNACIQSNKHAVKVASTVDGLEINGNSFSFDIDITGRTGNDILSKDSGITLSNCSTVNNIYDTAEFRLRNLTGAQIRDSRPPNENQIIRYQGDGTTDREFTTTYTPVAVQAFNYSDSSAIMVFTWSGTGSDKVDVSGNTITVNGTFNTSGVVYSLYVIC